MKQTAVEWLSHQISEIIGAIPLSQKQEENLIYTMNQALEMEAQQKLLLVEQLKDYTKEAQCILGNDEREASEFVEIFYKTTFKSE